MSPTHAELSALNKAHTLSGWYAQNKWNPISMARGQGVYFWDGDDKRYLDWASQTVCVNIGHSHPHVVKAIQEQAGKVLYAASNVATEPRARLAEMLQKVAPGDLNKTFFTLGGAESIENAMKIARMVTGRQKILGRYRAYHGASFGAMSIGGDPRKLANEPGVPWTIHIHDPYPYRSSLYRGRTQDEGDQALIDQIEDTILLEGPESIAAILLESYSGSSGILQGGDVYWRGIQNLCDKYNILLILDEVMSGFGRTGKWFGIEHYPYVKPDMIAMAKGLTSGYLPLGGVMMTDKIADYFGDNTFWCGLTYSGHALACAAGIANMEVYQNENLIENSHEMGKVLRASLLDLAEKHVCIGDVRGTGLLQVLELVKDRDTREPLSEFNKPFSDALQTVAASLRESGMFAFVRWNWIFCTPPLVATREHIAEGVAMLDTALTKADAYCH